VALVGKQNRKASVKCTPVIMRMTSASCEMGVDQEKGVV